MGSFKGHALPGSFFLVAGLWWTGKHSLWHVTRRNKNLGSGRVASRASQRRLELIESSIVVFFSFVGILAEQFADGPRLQLYNAAEKHWEDVMNWQHSTMYLFFGLAGIVSLIVHTTDVAPLALDRLMLAVAFFNEGFLFLYHLHGRTMLDVHVHQLLLYAVFGSAAVAFLEVFHRGNILMEMLRCTLTMLQGSWFWQIGFVLYPPHGPEWDLKDHNNMMFITMCYSWHLAFALLAVSMVYCTVSCVVRSRLKRTPPMEMGLLKPREREPESEDEIL
ncbi:transmembrane protein 45A [Takifugu rubripes]|uniref:Transmembrane protein 45a n=2 Tax=Takifugu TaxID=31032 RepID=H2TXW8_TAKRU|nr:transmembrane protein 45A [Takifugu rubripes]XP_056894895.1 transmembrane protein 45A [Takifugu flavidus]TWW57526.1 Transmembrane protein 45B [Takifugu flavidus]|eukprot:XP_003973881.1 PREDICTED: transmembrane protein 45A [Takifugu rubripes]